MHPLGNSSELFVSTETQHDHDIHFNGRRFTCEASTPEPNRYCILSLEIETVCVRQAEIRIKILNGNMGVARASLKQQRRRVKPWCLHTVSYFYLFFCWKLAFEFVILSRDLLQFQQPSQSVLWREKGNGIQCKICEAQQTICVVRLLTRFSRQFLRYFHAISPSQTGT